MQTILSNDWAGQELPNPGELGLNGGKACYEVYRTKDGRFLSVGALEYKFRKNFCIVIGKEHLIKRLNDPVEQQRMMKKEIQAVIQQKALAEWMVLFEGIDACVAPVLTPQEMKQNPQIKHRKMIEEIQHPTAGIVKQIANPIRLSGVKPTLYRHAPNLGERNDEILADLRTQFSTGGTARHERE